MKLYYKRSNKSVTYPYKVSGKEDSLKPIINYINTIKIYVKNVEPMNVSYNGEESGIFLCEEEMWNLQQNQELLGVELEEE